MKLLPMKKVINNITQPLNELISNAFANADTRRYFYNDCVWNANTRSYDATSNSNRTYTIPINGYYTIRAYNGDYGSYGKIIGRFKKGEVLKIDWARTGTQSINITSMSREKEEFQIMLEGTAIVNGTTNDYISALGIAGYGRGSPYPFSKDGYEATVRCNNGIAVGGGGGTNFASSYVSDGVRGYNGGTAYAYGNNVYAIGGGAGAGSGDNRGLGGGAIVNNNMVYATYSEARMNNGIYSCCGNPTNIDNTGGDGGCGGAGFVYEAGAILQVGCGYGFWGDGGNGVGGSAKGGSSYVKPRGTRMYARGRGYFAGGSSLVEGTSYTSLHIGWNAGNGGFYGGSGEAYNNVDRGNGGIGMYGFGGNGWYAGDGQLMGGSGDYGGNGLKAGTGTVSNGTAIRHKSIVHTLPAFNKTSNDSIVIIEYGISEDNY